MVSKLPIEDERKESFDKDFEVIYNDVCDRYDVVEQHLKRSHAELYGFLGFIYETAARIDKAINLRSALEQEVERIVNEERKPKRKWKARSKHDTFDLLLSLRMKHQPDTKASKSVWLAALRAAKERKDENGSGSPVEPTEAAFVEWITPIGVVEAGKRGKSGTSFDLCSFAEGLNIDSADFTIDLPAAVEPPGGMVLVLCQVLSRKENKADVACVEVIANERRVESLSRFTLNAWRKDQNTFATRFAAASAKAIQKEYGDPSEPDLVPDRSEVNGDFLKEVERNL